MRQEEYPAVPISPFLAEGDASHKVANANAGVCIGPDKQLLSRQLIV
jgi:hypothetical protein